MAKPISNVSSNALPQIIFGGKRLEEIHQFKLITSTKGNQLILTSTVPQKGPEIDPIMGKVEAIIKTAYKEINIQGSLFRSELHGDGQAMYQTLTIDID